MNVQHDRSSQGRICSDNPPCCHTDTTNNRVSLFVGWLLACLTSQQQASVSQGRICPDNFTCCHTEIEVADPTFYLTHSILTPGRPVPELTLSRQAPGRAATGVPIFESLV